MKIMRLKELKDLFDMEIDPVEERDKKLIGLTLSDFMDSIPESGVFESERLWCAYKDSLSDDANDMICIEVKYDSLYPKDMIALGNFVEKLSNEKYIDDVFFCGSDMGMILLSIHLKEKDIDKLNEFRAD